MGLQKNADEMQGNGKTKGGGQLNFCKSITLISDWKKKEKWMRGFEDLLKIHFYTLDSIGQHDGFFRATKNVVQTGAHKE